MIAIEIVSENFNEILKSSNDETLTRYELVDLVDLSSIMKIKYYFIPDFMAKTPLAAGWMMISEKDLEAYDYIIPRTPDRWFEIIHK